jgi:hypothetical protein
MVTATGFAGVGRGQRRATTTIASTSTAAAGAIHRSGEAGAGGGWFRIRASTAARERALAAGGGALVGQQRLGLEGEGAGDVQLAQHLGEGQPGPAHARVDGGERHVQLEGKLVHGDAVQLVADERRPVLLGQMGERP